MRNSRLLQPEPRRIVPALIAATLCAFAAGAALIATSAASRAQEQAARDKKTLEQRVADLEEQLAALRREVAEVRRGPAVSSSSTFRVQPRVVVPAPGGQQPVPPGSRPFGFNGDTYYWVPLEGGGVRRTAPAATPVGK